MRHWFKHNGERHAEGCRLAKVVTPVEKRKAVGHLCKEHDVSQRRACDVLAVDRSSVRYRSIRPNDADVRKAMKEVAAERRRFGYRRIHIMLKRQGIHMNQKKLRRLYREEGLQVRKRGGRIGHTPSDGRARDHQSALEPGLCFRRLHPLSADLLCKSPAGQWTGAGSAFSRWSMTSAANVWRLCPTRRCRARASCVRWTQSFRCAECR